MGNVEWGIATTAAITRDHLILHCEFNWYSNLESSSSKDGNTITKKLSKA